MTLNTYLHFNGDCREAFDFYRSIFGGDFEIVQTFGDGPPDMGIPDAEKNNIMHVSLRVGASMLMGSDVPAAFGPPPNKGNNFSISYDAQSKKETDDLFAKLSEGGVATMPPQDMFWGAYFGSCIDRFGISWMVSCEQQA